MQRIGEAGWTQPGASRRRRNGQNLRTGVLAAATAWVACVGGLAGCGGEDQQVRAATVAPDETIRVTGTEYAFDPGRIEAAGGRPLRFTLTNEGDLAHDLKVFQGERELGGVESFPAGEERSFRVSLGPGSYQLVCTVGDHRELGMEGELVVGPRR